VLDMAARLRRHPGKRASQRQLASSDGATPASGQLDSTTDGVNAGLNQQRGRQPIDPQRPCVLVISHESSATGAPILAWNIARAFNSHSNVVLLSLRSGKLDGAFLECCCVRLVLPDGVEASAEVLRAGLAQLPHGLKVDYALVNTMQAWRLPQWLQSQGIASVLLIHEFAAYIRPDEAFRHACTWATSVVFSSPITHAAMVQRHPELDGVPVVVLPQGRCELPGHGHASHRCQFQLTEIPELSELHPRGWLQECQLILGAGAVQPRKGVDLFVATAHRLQQLAPQRTLLFLWLGDGYDPEQDFTTSIWIEDQIQRSGLKDNLHILEGSATLYANLLPLAHLFLLTSRLDPLPNVAIDALSEGVPVLCFEQASGTATWMQDDPLLARHCLGRYLDPGHLAQKSLQLLDNSSLREQISAHGQQRAATSFAMASYVETLHQLGVSSQQKLQQQTIDRLLLKQRSILLPEFACSPSQTEEIDIQLAYLQSWSQRILPRKPFPGFHPGVYAEHHAGLPGLEDPLSHWLRNGQPGGAWSTPVIESKPGVPAVAADLQVGLHVHVFYPDLLEEILQRLCHNRTRPSLVVSFNNDEGSLGTVKQLLLHYGFDDADLVLAPNRGRDLGPFLVQCGRQLEQTCQIYGHLHTKRSALIDYKQANQWRTFLLDNLLGTAHAAMLDAITAAFATDAQLGLVYPDDPHVLGFGKNRNAAQSLCSQLKLDCALPTAFNFPVGSMFWARRGALAPLLNHGWSYEDFPSEPLGYDGTMLHAIERLLPLINRHQGFSEQVTHVSKVSR
jgi:glycosyltransferase involved in cell wall biosynthesis